MAKAALRGTALVAVLTIGLLMNTTAVAEPAELAPASDAAEVAVPPGCARIADAAQRLDCYDQAVAATPPAGALVKPGQASNWMSSDWELDAAHKRGTFRFFTYRPNFVLPVHYSSALNRAPSSPAPGRDAVLPEYRNVETKLQISLRTKLAENLLLPQADLWAGYTQVSLWQLWSGGESAPFRNTDYEPELIYMVPAPQTWSMLPGGWRWRFGQLGLAHQSNGQALPLSRSWNRVYVAAGLERGPLTAVLRLTHRLTEDAGDDDNPDLVSYRGRAELSGVWDGEVARAGLTWRGDPGRPRRGALQLDWIYPVGGSRSEGLNWYLQVFSGYGENLLDYNFRQTSIGLGVTLFNF